MRRLLVILFLLPNFSYAQMWEKLCIDDYTVDTFDTHALRAEIDALTFFRDNEYDSDIIKGYSLPGLWIKPTISYNPLTSIHLEAGAHLFIMNGANKYPNYAYHDIGTWKGNQYQHGVHALPWFRARANLKNLTFVLGNIYGGQNHRLNHILFNPEQNMSTDPEMGFQILLDRKHIHLDTWLNWQSYIFESDTHQEAFTVGTNAMILWGKEKSKLKWSTPIELIIQHRGGEQDLTAMGVQTLCNAKIGVRMDYIAHKRVLSNISSEINAFGSYQQSGKLWPFDAGVATNADASVTLWNSFMLKAGYFHAPKQYANLYGSPFFSTLSIKHSGLAFKGMKTAYVRADYIYTFSPAYKLGAEFEAFNTHTGGKSNVCFSFGIQLRVNPSFLIKKF